MTTTEITTLCITVFIIALAVLVISCLNKALREKDDEKNRYRSMYSDNFRQLSMLTSWCEAGRNRKFYIRHVGDKSYAVFMEASMTATEDPIPPCEVMLRRFNTSDTDYNRLLAEELMEKLNESYVI